MIELVNDIQKLLRKIEEARGSKSIDYKESQKDRIETIIRDLICQVALINEYAETIEEIISDMIDHY